MEKEKIQSLISQMTLEEKAGMCSGAGRNGCNDASDRKDF